ncbi:MAG: glycosyl hydrolase [Sulfuritalea sp.]|nr:glycosyl hydrolase [Sulfuritalea sp.]
MRPKLSVVALALALLAILSAAAAVERQPSRAISSLTEPPRLVAPEKAPVMAAALAGKRIVAVGDYGIVILADDGKAYRQAKAVPTRAVLTSVFFLDDKRGWAAGHDGTIVTTADGGETWQLQRDEPGKERVLLSIWFENALHGIAVGQFGLVLETDDGGKTWRERRLVEAGEQGDKHLMQIFAGANGLVFVVAESGSIFRSDDAGRNWKATQTDNKGSFWTGLVLQDGSILAAGMRGHVYRSTDRGLTWREVPVDSRQSLTAVLQRDDGQLVLYGSSGVVLSSKDNGQSLQGTVRADRANVTAAVSGPAGDVLFALSGLLVAK